MRGAPVVMRPEDYDVFVSGMLPSDEPSMRAFIGPAMTPVSAAGMSALDAVELVTNEASGALSKQPLDRDALHRELRKRVPKPLLPYCRGCDSHHVHPSLLYAAALRGRFVIFPGESGPYAVELAKRWLRAKRSPVPAVEDAPLSLLRRFMRAYGPSALGDFSAWAGLGGQYPRTL